MLEDETIFEFKKFIKELDQFAWIYIVLPGAVISGQFIRFNDAKTIVYLTNTETHTGGGKVETQDLSIPVEKIISWGDKED